MLVTPAELGVSGIHMYAVVADFVLKPSNYMHKPGSLRALQLEHHHLVTWRAFHPSKWSAHYYGQVRGTLHHQSSQVSFSRLPLLADTCPCRRIAEQIHIPGGQSLPQGHAVQQMQLCRKAILLEIRSSLTSELARPAARMR